MSHVDADTLALIALGEPAASPSQSEHLADCASCADSLAEFGLVVRIGRDSLVDLPLDRPRPQVWAGIASELHLRRQPRRRAWAPALVAVAAAVALIVGGIAGWQWLRPVPPELLATASLSAFPAWPSASGQAEVERLPDGSRVVRLTLDAPDEPGEYREAWLITSDASALVSLGVVDSSTTELAVPDDIDLALYDLVDVSAESDDGDPAHSGDSIVRGPLVPDPGA